VVCLGLEKKPSGKNNLSGEVECVSLQHTRATSLPSSLSLVARAREEVARMEEQRGSRSDADEPKEFDSAKLGASNEGIEDSEAQGGGASAYTGRTRLDSTTGGEGSDDDDDTVSFGDGKTSENPLERGAAPELDKYTIIRREKRLAMNRESARNRRQRKKQLIQTLDEQVVELRKSNQQLQATNDSLLVRIRVLESELAAARTTIQQLTNTGAMPHVPTHESSFQAQQQLPSQAQFLQQHTAQTGPSQSQQIMQSIYPNALSAPLSNPSMERNTTEGSAISNPFDPLRSFVRTGDFSTGMDTQRTSDVSGVSGGLSSQSMPEGSSNLSRLMQAQLDHLGRQGMSSTMNLSGGAGATSSWGIPSNVGTVPPFAFPSMEDSLRGVSTNWEMTERHDLSSTRGGMIPHSNRNTVSFPGLVFYRRINFIIFNTR
jgi:bZIP transcription factor